MKNIQVSYQDREVSMSPTKTKTCSSCKVEKTYTDYCTRKQEGGWYLVSKCKECSKGELKTKRKSNPEKGMLWQAKSRSNREGFEYDLTVEDMDWPTYCPVFGVKLEYTPQQIRSKNRATLDRLDPNEGYTLHNTRVICWEANRLKNNASLEQLELIIKYIKERS